MKKRERICISAKEAWEQLPSLCERSNEITFREKDLTMFVDYADIMIWRSYSFCPTDYIEYPDCICVAYRGGTYELNFVIKNHKAYYVKGPWHAFDLCIKTKRFF